ncbi:protein NETWORKED 3A-like [Coffea eugenioides]|uniref:protein NETWORKED 3A-like n=1 Tax=Coffea eugenioides TaxID=49369 RepID=UPI000F6072B5|nr:protein NETWORKED 3A-like [Coffea eugenioides]
MEKEGSDQAASDDSRWLEKNGSSYRNRSHHHQSQWLQSTLAELERKIQKILELVEDDGDTFAQRAEMYYKKRPELIRVVEDLRKSYISLANKYDILRSESLCASSNSFRLQSSLPSSAVLALHLHEAEAVNKGIITNPKNTCGQDEDRVRTSTTSSDLLEALTLSNSAHSLMMPGDACDEELIRRRDKGDGGGNRKVCKINGGFDDSRRDRDGDSSTIRIGSKYEYEAEREDMWNKMRQSVSELMDDSLSQQAELIRRNNEKTESIKRLGPYINQLQNENKRLKELLAQQQQQQQNKNTADDRDRDCKHNRSHLSKLKGLVFRKKV